MNQDNSIEFVVLTDELWTATKTYGLWASDLAVFFAQSSYLSRKGTIPFVGAETVAREAGLSVRQVARCRENLVAAGLLTDEGYTLTDRGRKTCQYLPTCIYLTGHVPEEKKEKRGLTMRICEMRNDASLKNLEPVVVFLLQYAVEGCEGLLDLGLMPDPEDGSEPDVVSFAQFLVDEGQCRNLHQARKLIQRLKDRGVVESRQRYRPGKRGRLAAFYFLNLPIN